MKSIIVGVCGDIGSGKDSVAEHLVANHGFKRVSFAAKLKDLAAELLPCDPDHFKGTQAEKNAPINTLGLVSVFFAQFRYSGSPWPDRVGQPWTGRFVLEFLGTDVFRALYAPVWVEYLKRVVEADRDEWLTQGGPGSVDIGAMRHVVSDVRFANLDGRPGCEFSMVRDLGGFLIRTTKTGAESTTTGHVSDNSWRTASVEVELAAAHGELAKLFTGADEALRTWGVIP